jgi:tetratricopeptide (TPR) repeat protein
MRKIRGLAFAALLLATAAHADDSVDVLNHRMMQLYADGYYEQAIPLAAQIVAALEKSAGPTSPEVASALNNEAELYNKLHRFSEAEPLYRRSLAIRRAVLGPDNPDTQKSLARLAELFHAEGKDVMPQQQQAQPQQQQPVQRPAAPPPRPMPQPQPRQPAISQQEFQHAIELNQQGIQLGEQGHFAEAIPPATQALAIFEKAFGADNLNVAIGSGNLGQLYVQAGQFDKAEPLYKRAVAILEKHADKQRDLGMMLAGLADLYTRQKRYADAEPYYRRAIPLLDKNAGSDNSTTLAMINNFADILRTEGKDPDAEPVLKGRWEKTAHFSLPRFRSAGAPPEMPATQADPADLDRSRVLDRKIYALVGEKDFAEALPVAQEQQTLLEKMYGADNPAVAVNLDTLANILRNLGRAAEAEPLVKRSQAIRDANKAIDQINR